MHVVLSRTDGIAIAEGGWIDLRAAVEANKANLAEANLTGANLTGANLIWANLTGANLTGANLIWANLIWANLTWANLTGANLTGANLAGANLAGANLAGANLAGANFTKANFIGANLAGATLPTGATWEEFVTNSVPALLTAGGKSLPDVLATGCWDCHDWSNCPMHAALGISGPDDAPEHLRPLVREFVPLFDAGLIPMPVALKAERRI